MPFETNDQLLDLLYQLIPKDGTTIGNVTLLQKFREKTKKELDITINDDDY